MEGPDEEIEWERDDEGVCMSRARGVKAWTSGILVWRSNGDRSPCEDGHGKWI